MDTPTERERTPKMTRDELLAAAAAAETEAEEHESRARRARVRAIAFRERADRKPAEISEHPKIVPTCWLGGSGDEPKDAVAVAPCAVCEQPTPAASAVAHFATINGRRVYLAWTCPGECVRIYERDHLRTAISAA